MWLILAISAKAENGRFFQYKPENELIMAIEDTEKDRFELWSNCDAMNLDVTFQKMDDSSGLTKETIVTLIRSRLRAARLFSDGTIETGIPSGGVLRVHVHTVGLAYTVQFEFMKSFIIDTTSNIISPVAVTWETDMLGTHNASSNQIISTISKNIDHFIDEYLRINADACDSEALSSQD